MKKFLALLLAAVMCLSLFACGGNAQKETTKAAEESKTTAAATTEAAKKDEPVYGGELNLFYNMSIPTFWANSTTMPMAYALTWPCIEPLGYENGDGSYTLYVAESMVRDNDKKTVTVKVHPNVKFHDGSILTAETLAWNIQTCIDKGIAKSIGNPVSVEVTGDFEVTVHYDTFSLLWEKLLCKVWLYSKEAYDKNGEEWMATNLCGTGPFKMTNYEIEKEMEFSRFDEYWGGKPYLDKITWNFISDTTAQLSSFLNGELDYIDTANDNTIQSILAATGINEITPFEYCSSNYIMFNSTIEGDPWNNSLVRRAVCNYGIDWEGITYAIKGKSGIYNYTSALPNANHYVENDYDCDWGYDKEKALAMLKEAGYEKGFETTIYSNAGVADIAALVQSALADLNITAKVEMVTGYQDWQNDGNMSGLIVNGEFTYADWSSRVSDYYSANGMFKNVIGFSDKYLSTYDKFTAATSREEADKLLKELCYIMYYEEAYMCTTCMSPTRFFAHDNTHGWENCRYPAGFNASKLWKDAE